MEQCRDAGYGRKRITNNMMCAGYHDGRRDACQVRKVEKKKEISIPNYIKIIIKPLNP